MFGQAAIAASAAFDIDSDAAAAAAVAAGGRISQRRLRNKMIQLNVQHALCKLAAAAAAAVAAAAAAAAAPTSLLLLLAHMLFAILVPTPGLHNGSGYSSPLAIMCYANLLLLLPPPLAADPAPVAAAAPTSACTIVS